MRFGASKRRPHSPRSKLPVRKRGAAANRAVTSTKAGITGVRIKSINHRDTETQLDEISLPSCVSVSLWLIPSQTNPTAIRYNGELTSEYPATSSEYPETSSEYLSPSSEYPAPTSGYFSSTSTYLSATSEYVAQASEYLSEASTYPATTKESAQEVCESFIHDFVNWKDHADSVLSCCANCLLSRRIVE
jgi:hypothetical protein